MKKTLFTTVLLCCGFILPLSAAPSDAKAEFNATVKYVDAGGEFFYYQNNKALDDLINKKMPVLLKMMWKDETYNNTADCALDSLLKIINIKAFKAQANSSEETAPGFFVNKSFMLIDMSAKSILLDPKAKNVPMDFLSLPADTRIALKGRVNFAHAWKLIYAEIQNSSDPTIKSLPAQLDNLKAAGFDVPMIISGIDGDLEILVTGTTLQDLAVKIVIPDSNGAVTDLLKKFVPPQQGDTAVLPTPIGNINIVYGKGKVTAVSNPKLLSAPQKTLAALPAYAEFAATLPKSGTCYLILDLPKETIDFAKAQIGKDKAEILSIIDLFVKPASLVSVGRVENDGISAVTVSNFSIPQLVQTIQASIGLFPLLSTPLALGEARQRGAVASCQSDLKHFGLCCLLYAADNKDTLPPDAAALTKNGYDLDKEICENIIFLANGAKITSFTTPAIMPIAICSRAKHKDDTVCVLFADGHVETIQVPAGADNREVLAVLHKEYNFSAEYLDQLVKKVSEGEK